MSERSSMEELIRRARAGDAAARDELFGKCRNYLQIVARAQVEGSLHLQAKVDASDVVQQTLLEAHHSLAGFRGCTEGQWLAWLRQLLTHNAADMVRQYRGTEKRQVAREVPLAAGDRSSDPHAPQLPDAGESPSAQLIRREREVQVADALAQLSDDYQEVILLRNLQQLPFDEVARRMNRSRPAVQMLWMRALRQLQELLEDDSR